MNKVQICKMMTDIHSWILLIQRFISILFGSKSAVFQATTFKILHFCSYICESHFWKNLRSFYARWSILGTSQLLQSQMNCLNDIESASTIIIWKNLSKIYSFSTLQQPQLVPRFWGQFLQMVGKFNIQKLFFKRPFCFWGVETTAAYCNSFYTHNQYVLTIVVFSFSIAPTAIVSNVSKSLRASFFFTTFHLTCACMPL